MTLPSLRGLDLRQVDAAGFATAFDGFLGRFVACHAGYDSCRPDLLPLLVPESTAEAISGATRDCLGGVRDILVRGLASDGSAFLEELGYEANAGWLADMATTDAPSLFTAFARADFVLSTLGPRLVELNVGPTVSGLGMMDRYADLATEAIGRLAGPDAARRLTLPRPSRAWADYLRALPGMDPVGRRPRVALVIPDEDAGSVPPDEAAWALRREGIDAEVVRVGDVSFGEGSASVGGASVDLVYGCFVYAETVSPPYRAFVQRALECRAAGGPFYVAPPLVNVLGNKGFLALVGDELTESARSLLAPTRPLVRDGLGHAAEHRERLVLKPTMAFGGRGVTLGRDCSPDGWIQLLEQASGHRGRFVLQDHLESAAFELPTARGSARYRVVLGCLVVGGRLAGLYTRYLPFDSGEVVNIGFGATFSVACQVRDEELERWSWRP
jgi:hypothetical protein